MWLQTWFISVGKTRGGGSLSFHNSIEEKYFPLFHFPVGFSICATRQKQGRRKLQENEHVPVILHALNLHLSLELADIISTASNEGIRMARNKTKFLLPIARGSIAVLLALPRGTLGIS